VRIRGRVQGVGYRAWTQRTAKKLKLVGWVRNLSDGSVEAQAQGSPDAISAFLSACQSGPLLARVTEVDSEACVLNAALKDFEQRDTANPV
jgi:acylphosphatase